MSRPSIVAALALLLLGACADFTTAPSADVAAARHAARGPDALTIVDGSTGPGSTYRFVVPDNWNGRLLVYAHGYVVEGLPLTLPPEADLFATLAASLGMATAYSSYSGTGWEVKDGAQRTHQLLGLFTSQFGNPTRTYLAGASMGGLIATKLVEKHPGQYDGALAACSISAGLLDYFTYQAHVRAVFDVLYPNALPGSATSLPPGVTPTQIVALAQAAITANPAPALSMALLDQTPLPGVNPAEVVQSILNALASNAQSLVELQELTRGKPYFDNSATVYSSALLPAPP